MDDFAPVVIFLLVTLGVAGLLYILAQPHMSRTQHMRQRMQTALATTSTPDPTSRTKSIEDFIREANESEAMIQVKRLTLGQRMQQAELQLSVTQYWLASFGTGGLIFALLSVLTSQSLPIISAIAVALGFLLPHLYVERRRNGRFRRFTQEFPNAVDVVVRGVKSGLPLADCLRIIAAEAQDPVKSEFKRVVEDQTLGMTNEDAVQRLAVRVPIPEVRFFGIVIAIQSRTGGSLAEALGNLSRVLRDRKKMREKIKAMSSEAKASAGIIASLPFAVSFFVYLTSPDYISLLFTTTLGNLILLGCGIWMGIGVLVMRKMINFEI